MAQPHNRFIDAVITAGWQVVREEPFASGPNPPVLEIRRGRTTHLLLVYAWKITSEGTGRKKAGRADLDFRIQTTRSHDGPLASPAMHSTLGIGWDESRGVFAAFDPWLKRYTSYSSSVHITRALLDAAAKDGWATEEREDGPEVAFSPDNVDRYFEWAFASAQRPLFAVDQVKFDRTGQVAVIKIDPYSDRHGFAIRPGDSIVVMDHKKIVDPSIWTVESIESEAKATSSGRYNRVMLKLNTRRKGVIKDVDTLERELE